MWRLTDPSSALLDRRGACRGAVWDHSSWIDPASSGIPDVCETYAELLGGEITPTELRVSMEQHYADEVAAERELR